MVTVSAPGKIHFMGEHAVVYGRPALLAAINKRVTVRVEPSANNESNQYLQDIIHIVLTYFHIQDEQKFSLSVSSDIPAGYHLGSSAAVAVATVGALTYFLKKVWNPTVINQLAYEAEKIQHGNPSGGDNTASTLGGLLWYRREFEYLKSMWQLPFGVHTDVNHFFLINTGKPEESTKEMVALVATNVTRERDKMEQLFSANEKQTKRITEALKMGDQRMLIDAMQQGERTLEGMGVVSRKVIPLIRKIEGMGGAAKILGGGGRKKNVGFLLCYHADQNRIQKICEEYTYPIESVIPSGEGVRLDEK
jgi:mevalonate kinase